MEQHPLPIKKPAPIEQLSLISSTRKIQYAHTSTQAQVRTYFILGLALHSHNNSVNSQSISVKYILDQNKYSVITKNVDRHDGRTIGIMVLQFKQQTAYFTIKLRRFSLHSSPHVKTASHRVYAARPSKRRHWITLSSLDTGIPLIHSGDVIKITSQVSLSVC